VNKEEKSERASVTSETEDRDGALLGVALEARAASDARVAPTPYVVAATCQWLGASRAFLETPDALTIERGGYDACIRKRVRRLCIDIERRHER
jgi:hypothetical protein